MAKWRETPNFALKSFPSTHWHTPKSVKQLAAHVATVFPAAFCSVQYFDKDPILYIHLDGKRHCLAIWDKGVVRAVPDGWKLPLRQRIARHFVKLV
jgi:hypothetical protein